EDLARIAEPNVFLVDDVAFIHPEHGFAIGQEIERRGIKKEYYLETRCDVLVKNRDVFEYWKRLGLRYMFLGLEALDEEGLKLHRKRVTPGENFQALEIARELDFTVAINIIADPDWAERRFDIVREWPSSVPGQTNFVRSLSKWNSVYHPDRQSGDHARPVKYAMKPPALVPNPRPRSRQLYVHQPMGRSA